MDDAERIFVVDRKDGQCNCHHGSKYYAEAICYDRLGVKDAAGPRKGQKPTF
jgi:hypothetical protein